MKVEKGQLLVFTVGEYSDYSIDGLAVVQQPFETDDMESQHKKSVLQTEDLPTLPVWLEQAGLTKRVTAREWWLDHYPHGRELDEV